MEYNVEWRARSLPQDLFSSILGYEDIKDLFRRSMLAAKQTHILLVGPPASAKSVFLLECARVKYSYYALGYKVTKAGLIQLLFSLYPGYLLIDEIDKMEKQATFTLLGLMDPGYISDVVYDKQRVRRFYTNVYAACNTEDSLPEALLSRFHFKLHLKRLSRQEFMELTANVLVKLEGLPWVLASYIARRLSDRTYNVREAVGLARLARSIDDVDRLIELQDRYRREGNSLRESFPSLDYG